MIKLYLSFDMKTNWDEVQSVFDRNGVDLTFYDGKNEAVFNASNTFARVYFIEFLQAKNFYVRVPDEETAMMIKLSLP